MSELTPVSIKKLKVAELRAELSKLGLDTKGTKPILVERLVESISGQNEEKDAVTEANTEEDNETDSKEESSQESQDESSSAKAVEPVESVEPLQIKTDTKSKVEDANVEDAKVSEEKPVAESEKMETEDESPVAEASNKTEEKESAEKTEDVVTEPPEDGDKVPKEEAMDQTPAKTTPSKPRATLHLSWRPETRCGARWTPRVTSSMYRQVQIT